MKSVVVLPAHLLSLQRQLNRASVALQYLTQSGLKVERIELHPFTRPTITVEYNHHCQHKLQTGEAVKYTFGKDHAGHYEKYQIQLHHCRINWEVRRRALKTDNKITH